MKYQSSKLETNSIIKDEKMMDADWCNWDYLGICIWSSPTKTLEKGTSDCLA